jgi:hypothetical protein
MSTFSRLPRHLLQLSCGLHGPDHREVHNGHNDNDRHHPLAPASDGALPSAGGFDAQVSAVDAANQPQFQEGLAPHHPMATPWVASQMPQPGSSGHPLPLRGNWPFTVRTPHAPVTAPAPAVDERTDRAGDTTSHAASQHFGRSSHAESCHSFAVAPATGTRCSAYSAKIAADCNSSRPLKVRRRSSDSGTVGLVIAGRMADVCAELERMVALEALQRS